MGDTDPVYRRRIVLVMVAFYLPVAAIITIGFITDHVALALIAIVALLALASAVNTVWFLRGRRRASRDVLTPVAREMRHRGCPDRRGPGMSMP